MENNGQGDQFNIEDPDLPLSELWKLELVKHKNNLEETCLQAKEEFKTDIELSKLMKFWKNSDFDLIKHLNSEVNMLKIKDEDYQRLEEDI